jgi:hypothetical protein
VIEVTPATAEPVAEVIAEPSYDPPAYQPVVLSNPERRSEPDDEFTEKTPEGDYARPDRMTKDPQDEVNAWSEGFTTVKGETE